MKPLLKLALAGVALSFQATAATAADPERIDKPAVKVGTSWRMRVADGMTRVPISETHYRIAAVTDAEVQIHDDAGEPIVLLDIADYGVKRLGDIVFDPMVQRLRYPLAPGGRWESTYRYSTAQCGATQATMSYKVAAWEDVTLPAGKFRALRVESSGFVRNGCGNNQQAHKHWYVMDHPVPVRQESTYYAGPRISRFELHEMVSLTTP